MNTPRNKTVFNIIEAPVCTGSPTSGSELACTALKSASIASAFEDNAVFTPYGDPPKEVGGYPDNMKHLGVVMSVSNRIRENVLRAASEGEFPVVIGGDHSVAIGTIAAISEHYGAENTAVVYIDGHADINTEKSTVSGYIHGMPLASSLGLCDDRLSVGKGRVKLFGENLHILGARSIDEGEYPIIKENNVDLIDSTECLALGSDNVADRVISRLRGKKVAISFDVDSMDKSEFSSTGYLMDGGLSFEYVMRLISRIMSACDVVSFECVEYNPLMDKDKRDISKLIKIFEAVYSSLTDKN